MPKYFKVRRKHCEEEAPKRWMVGLL